MYPGPLASPEIPAIKTCKKKIDLQGHIAIHGLLKKKETIGNDTNYGDWPVPYIFSRCEVNTDKPCDYGKPFEYTSMNKLFG